MTDEEYERLKEAEKAHLRVKKRHRDVVSALKRRGRLTNAVRDMVESARRLFEEHDTLVEALSVEAARTEARAEGALAEGDEGLVDAEDALREERAAELVRQYKQALRASSGVSEGDPSSSSGGDETTDARPDKTIGRMREPRGSDE